MGINDPAVVDRLRPAMSQETRQSYRPAIIMSVCAAGAFGVLLYLDRPLLSSVAAFLSIEGTVLLACSIQPDDPALWKTWRERLLGTSFAEPVGFIPLFFYLGLLFLALAAFIGAFSGGPSRECQPGV
jgi:hypothetical protein